MHQRLKLLSYNIQAGANINRIGEYVTKSWRHVLPHPAKTKNLQLVASLLAEYDIVALQEADGGSLRSGFQNQTQHLAELAGFPFWSHQPNRKLAKLAEPSNGLLTRFQPSEVISHQLPGALPGRGALEVRFGDSRLALHLIIAHLSLTPRARRAQLAFLAELIADLPYVVLMGDFNCAVQSAEMSVLFQKTRLKTPTQSPYTFPSWRPRKAIDHILASDLLRTEGYAVPTVFASDHLPIALTVELPVLCPSADILQKPINPAAFQ